MQFNICHATENDAQIKLVNLSLTKEHEYRQQNKKIIVANGSTVNSDISEDITSLAPLNVPLTVLASRVSNYNVFEKPCTPNLPNNSDITYDLDFNLYTVNTGGFCKLITCIGDIAVVMSHPLESVIDTIKHSDVDLTDQATVDTLIRLSKGLDIIK